MLARLVGPYARRRLRPLTRGAAAPPHPCTQGLSAWAAFAHSATGLATPEVDSFIKASVFATLTNVNFDPQRFRDYITTAGAPPLHPAPAHARPLCASRLAAPPVHTPASQLPAAGSRQRAPPCSCPAPPPPQTPTGT